MLPYPMPSMAKVRNPTLCCSHSRSPFHTRKVSLPRQHSACLSSSITPGSARGSQLMSLSSQGSGQHESKRVRHAWKASPSYISSLPVSSATSAGIHERIHRRHCFGLIFAIPLKHHNHRHVRGPWIYPCPCQLRLHHGASSQSGIVTASKRDPRSVSAGVSQGDPAVNIQRLFPGCCPLGEQS
jgi:hypothetical protein